MTKAEARKYGRAVRAGMPGEVRAALSARIVERCQVELDWGSYARVHVFLPIEGRGEVDTWPLVKWVWEMWPGVRVYVPRLAGGQMEPVEVTGTTRFETNKLGIPEPAGGRILGPGEQVDLVLVPLLAFDERGNRVGYGGGYYDRWLAGQVGARKVGLAYRACLVADGIEAEAHDVRLNAVATEAGMLPRT